MREQLDMLGPAKTSVSLGPLVELEHNGRSYRVEVIERCGRPHVLVERRQPDGEWQEVRFRATRVTIAQLAGVAVWEPAERGLRIYNIGMEGR